MRIILDTDKKTIMLPWNYKDKLAAINKLIAEVSDEPSKQKPLQAILMRFGDMQSNIPTRRFLLLPSQSGQRVEMSKSLFRIFSKLKRNYFFVVYLWYNRRKKTRMRKAMRNLSK